MGVFDFLTTKAAIVRDAAQDVANDIRWRIGTWGGSVVPPQSIYEAEVAVLHPIVFRCVEKIALTVQGVDWYVQKKGEKDLGKRKYTTGVEKAVADLLENPSDTMSAAQLRYWLALNLALYGNVFLKIGCDRAKLWPNGIYPLLTAKTTLIGNGKGQVTGYKTRGAQGSDIDIPTRREAMAKKKLAEGYAGHIFKPALDYVNKTHSPLQSLGVAPVVWTSLMERCLETARGQPNVKYVVTADSALTAPQRDDVARELDERKVGGESAGNVLMLSGVNIKFQTVDNGMKDIHTKMPLDDMTRQIAAVYGVPTPTLGLAAADGSKFAGNYSEARLSFIEDTVVPGYLALIEDGLTDMLCPDGYEIRFDLDSIEAIRNRRFSVAKDLSVVPFLTINEKRKAIGFGELTPEEIAKLPPIAAPAAPKAGVPANAAPEEPDDDGT